MTAIDRLRAEYEEWRSHGAASLAVVEAVLAEHALMREALDALPGVGAPGWCPLGCGGGDGRHAADCLLRGLPTPFGGVPRFDEPECDLALARVEGQDAKEGTDE